VLPRLGSLIRRLRRGVLRRRRPLAFALTALAVLLALHVARPSPPATVSLTVAARDLPAGTVLAPADLARLDVAPGQVPDGARPSPAGATLAAPIRRGEPVTDTRLIGPALTAGVPGLVAVPVRVSDAVMAGLLHVGDRLRLLSTSSTTGRTVAVADGVRVLALPSSGSPSGSQDVGPNGVTTGDDGRLIVVGVDDGLVAPVTSAGVGGFLSFAWSD